MTRKNGDFSRKNGDFSRKVKKKLTKNLELVEKVLVSLFQEVQFRIVQRKMAMPIDFTVLITQETATKTE